MRQLMAFIRTTVMGGFLVVLPIALLILLLIEAIELVDLVTNPVVAILGIDEIVGIESAFLLSLVLILLTCFLTGLVLASHFGSRAIAFLERTLLNRVPGYRMIKSFTTSLATVGDQRRFAAALVNLYGDGTRVLGFIVDELENADYAVFVPNAPNPVSGTVYFVARDRVEHLAVPVGVVVNSLMQWGVDSGQLLKQR